MRNAPRWVLLLTSLASFVVVLDLLVVATALSTIRRELGASVAELEWTINAYTLSFAVLLMTAAALGDRFGRRRLFAIGLGLFGAASAACAAAPTIGWLIAARAVQGVGAAILMPLALAQLNAAFPPLRRGRALGIYGSITGLAVLLGPIVGGAVTQGLAWRWVFWLNVPLTILAIPAVLARMEETRGPRVTLDIPGLLLLTGAALGLVWGLVHGNEAGWTRREILGSLGAGAALALAFASVEARVRAPLVPMRLFRSRSFSTGNAAVFFLQASMTGAIFFQAQYQQIARGLGPLDAGLRLLPWGIGPFLVAPRAGALADRVGERPLIVLGLALHTIGAAGMGRAASAGAGDVAMMAAMTLGGVGFALAIPAVTKSVVGAVALEDVGKASGTFNTLRQLGASFGVALLAAAFASAGSYRSPAAFRHGCAAAFGVAALLSLGGLVCAAARWGEARSGRTVDGHA